MHTHDERDPDCAAPSRCPWTERPWASWPARHTPPRLTSRRHALHEASHAGSHALIAADQFGVIAAPTVVVVWSGHGRWVVLDRLARAQWVYAAARLADAELVGTPLHARAYAAPGACFDAVDAIELAARLGVGSASTPFGKVPL